MPGVYIFQRNFYFSEPYLAIFLFFKNQSFKNIQIFKKNICILCIYLFITYISLQKSGAVLFGFQKTSRIFYSSEFPQNFYKFRGKVYSSVSLSAHLNGNIYTPGLSSSLYWITSLDQDWNQALVNNPKYSLGGSKVNFFCTSDSLKNKNSL